MKKYCMIAAVMVLTLTVFTGCGCTKNRGPANTKPTEMTIAPTVLPTTMPTEHTTIPTEKETHATENTIIPDVTDHMGTEAATETDGTDHNAATEEAQNRARTVK